MRRKREGWLGFFAFLFLWVKGCCCSRAPQKKRQASQEAKAACLFISLSRFCWRNETKAKRKKRAAQPTNEWDCFSCWVSLLWVIGCRCSHSSATKETSPNKKKSNWIHEVEWSRRNWFVSELMKRNGKPRKWNGMNLWMEFLFAGGNEVESTSAAPSEAR